VVELLVDPVVEKQRISLNNLLKNYNEDAAADKNFISRTPLVLLPIVWR
jgi:hypothetical protein